MRRLKIATMVEHVVSDARRVRQGKPALGVAGVLAMDPFTETPMEEANPPKAHCSNPALFAEYLEQRTAFLNTYRSASHAWRSEPHGDIFPPSGFPPPPPFEHGEH